MIFEVSGVHMGRYGLILCANESYTNNLAFGINFDLISAYRKTKNTKKYINIKQIKNHVQCLVFTEEQCLVFTEEQCLVFTEEQCLVFTEEQCLVLMSCSYRRRMSCFYGGIISCFYRRRMSCCDRRRMSCCYRRTMSCCHRRTMSCCFRRTRSCCGTRTGSFFLKIFKNHVFWRFGVQNWDPEVPIGHFCRKFRSGCI